MAGRTRRRRRGPRLAKAALRIAVGAALAGLTAACGFSSNAGQAPASVAAALSTSGTTIIAHGSQSAEDLAQASIDVQQIRGDAVLNVISRSGSTSFQDDFNITSERIGHGPGTLLTDAAAAQPADGKAASLVAAAEREATAWRAANAEVYTLGLAANYAGEKTKVTGTGAGNTTDGYNTLGADIRKAIGDDQDAFQSAAAQGSGALDPLEPVVIVSSLLMALGCLRGLRRRLAEYR